MADAIIAILWLSAAGNWLLSILVFYISFKGMHEMALVGNNFGLFGSFQGIGLGLILIVIGAIIGAIAILIGEIKKIRLGLEKEDLELLKEGD